MRSRHVLQPSLFLTLAVQSCRGATASNSTQVPVSIDFGTDFYGVDGLWSTAQVRVGTPQQYVSLFPNTVSSETWVIGPAGCDTSVECATSRGGLFYSTKSSSYEELGQFELGSNRLGNTTDYGDYALDVISVQDSVSAPHQILATLTGLGTWLGQFGLGAKEVRFEDTTNYLPFISTLVQNTSVIPSHSYGYTAGAHYALKSVPGSLTLGGVDTTRYTPNGASFALGPGYLPILSVRGITVTSSQSQDLAALPPNWNANPLTLLEPSQAELFTIDTSTPFMWMPPAVCETFASALNLTYDDNLQLYMFSNDSSPEDLSDMTFTFTLADSDDATHTVQLPISYNAFNLQLSYGFPNLNITYGSPAVNYFPLRKANSSSLYTIGRAFLQETYLTVDYERNNFSLSAAVFPDTSTVLPQIVPISRPLNSQWPGPVQPTEESTFLSTGAKIGIGIGISLAFVVVFVLACLFFRRGRMSAEGNEKTDSKKRFILGQVFKKSQKSTEVISELSGDRHHARELLVDPSNTRYELAGQAPIEMPAAEVPATFFATSRTVSELPSPIDNPTPSAAFRRPNGASVRKDYNIRAAVTERSTSPAPPYSPSETDRGHSASGGISPFDSGGSAGFRSRLSGEAGISPVVRYNPSMYSNGSDSPISPARPGPPSAAASRVASATRSNPSNSGSLVPTDRIIRIRSNSDRPRTEGMMDNERQRSANGEAPAQARARFSWEE